MSTVPLATLACPSLADTVDEVLAATLAGRAGRCLWCGASAIAIDSSDIWSGQVSVKCGSCGSELSGVVPRHLREVRR